jgi:hypothetical protein
MHCTKSSSLRSTTHSSTITAAATTTAIVVVVGSSFANNYSFASFANSIAATAAADS